MGEGVEVVSGDRTGEPELLSLKKSDTIDEFFQRGVR